jgi:hypothetical protein
LVDCECDPCEGYRSSRHLAHGDPGYFGILFDMAGTELVRQGNRETTLRPGDFIIWDSAQKMEFRVLEPLHKLTILASKSLLDRFLPRAEQFAGMRIEGTATLGPVVGAYLRQLWRA